MNVSNDDSIMSESISTENISTESIPTTQEDANSMMTENVIVIDDIFKKKYSRNNVRI